MLRFLKTMFVVVSMLLATTAGAAEFGTSEEAQAMVERAIAHYDKVGREAAFKDFSDNKGAFIDRDLYVLVLDQNSVMLAHGVNRGLIGKNLAELKDVNGKFILPEMVEMAKTTPAGGWVEYVWTNPTTKKLDPKKTWVKLHDGIIIGVGIYDKNRTAQ